MFFGGKNKGFGVSGDVVISENTGIFLRIGSGNSQDFLSGGFEIREVLFKDKLGLGYAYLHGKRNTYVSELYYSVEIRKYFSVSFDLQYLKESRDTIIYGLRLYFER